MPERERIWFCAWKRTNFGNGTIIHRSDIQFTIKTAIFKCPCTSSYWRQVSFFTSTTAKQTDSAVRWAQPTNTANPTMGRVTNITTPEKRTNFVTGRRQNSFDRQVSWKRTNFLSETLWKEQIKQWYVWLISGQQLLLFLFYHKTLNTIEDMICMHRQTCFLEYTDGSMCNVDLDLWSHRASYLSRSLTEC